MTQVETDVPTLLLAECGEENQNVVLLNERSVIPKLRSKKGK